mmetsp:Transcript_58935/g.164677  ORF Transcript_58935/g.164677 Transcript_58935/m.164677 type:complete len:497 (-) Transcript_58935:157-1647(-)
MASILWRVCGLASLVAPAWASHRLPLEQVRRKALPSAELLAGFSPGQGLELFELGLDDAVKDAPASPATPFAAVNMTPLVGNIDSPQAATPTTLVGSVGEMRARLQNDFDLLYIIAATFGTPPQLMRLIVDTGSSDLWVDAKKYSTEASATAVVSSQPALLNYGMGRVIGKQAKDTVCVLPICIQNDPFVLAETVLGIGNGGFFDGLLGLAFPGLAQSAGTTFVEIATEQAPFRKFAFGLALRGQLNPSGSFINFGDLDDLLHEASAVTGSSGLALPVYGLNFVPLFWMVNGHVSIGSTTQSIFAALDSGTSLIALPIWSYVTTVTALLPSNFRTQCAGVLGQMICPCALQLKPMVFRFTDSHGETLTITLGSAELLEFVGDVIFSGGVLPVCRLAIQPGPSTMPFWILGDAFLRRVYVVHDVVGRQAVLFPQPHSADRLDVGQRAVDLPQHGPGTATFVLLVALAMMLMGAAAMTALRWRNSVGAASTADNYDRL